MDSAQCAHWERPSEICEIVIFESKLEYELEYSNLEFQYELEYSNSNSNITISQISDGRSHSVEIIYTWSA